VLTPNAVLTIDQDGFVIARHDSRCRRDEFYGEEQGLGNMSERCEFLWCANIKEMDLTLTDQLLGLSSVDVART